ncbi:MAG: exonuclease domain-containing protein [Candidatus Omnitrophica bacterium]|nr:exonuclease domain-containing protein [Candidatus Omnitrophota bacterium]MCM8806578.1 exonuclease domain-containing protein [Candidatus Omnitrophota bacterium]
MKFKINEIVALDTETTGLNPENDRICEIALLKIKNGKIVENESFSTLINPERDIPKEITFISGIRNEDVYDKKNFKDRIDVIYNLINGKIILCHNSSFDISFLEKEFERCGLDFPEIKIIDTYWIAKRFFRFKKNSLNYLTKYFGIKRNIEHRAEEDAKATFEIFKILCENLYKKRVTNYKSFNLLHLYRLFKNNFIKKLTFEFEKKKCKVEKIEKALKDGKEIFITYSNKKGDILQRKIKPLEIIEENGVKYLKAFCTLKKEERKFRFDRIFKIREN